MVGDLGLAGKRVVVTGAAGGLGRSFALGFAQAGAKVLVADINESGAAETAEMLDGGAAFCGLDVADRNSAMALAAKAQGCLGGVDVLVNNAALYATLKRAPFMEIEEDDWDRAMTVNAKGVWQVTRAIAPLMQAQRAGSIINIASATVFSGSPEWMHYVASKGAVIAMTRVMAKELGTDNIRANVIAPGFTLTDASYGHMADAKTYGVDRAALKRNAEAEDIVGGALYLASPLSGFMTGQTLVIDGGKQFI